MSTTNLSTGLTTAQSRRAAIQTGGTLAAALSLFGQRTAAAQDSTPQAETTGANALLVQSFNSGTLFPTQGDAGGPPYTLYLWEVADRGTFFVDPANHTSGIVATEPVLAAIMSVNEQPRAVLVAMVKQNDNEEPHQEIWALKLASPQTVPIRARSPTRATSSAARKRMPGSATRDVQDRGSAESRAWLFHPPRASRLRRGQRGRPATAPGLGTPVI